MLPVILLQLGSIELIGMNINVILLLLMLVFSTDQTFKYRVGGRKWIMRSAADSYEEDNEYLGSIHVWGKGGGYLDTTSTSTLTSRHMLYGTD